MTNFKQKNSVSCILLSHNQPEYLNQALTGISNSTSQFDEIVIVDDGSEQDITPIVQQFSSLPVRLILKSHSGIPDSRNVGILEASSDFILWHAGDDVIFPSTLKLYNEYISKNSCIDILTGDLVRTDENLKPIGEFRTNEWKGDRNILISDLLFFNPLTDPFFLIRKSFFEKTGLYDLSFQRCNDWEWASRAAMSAKIGHVNRFVGYWRKHKNSVTEGAKITRDFKFDKMVQQLHIQRYKAEDLLKTINFEFLQGIQTTRDIIIWGCGRMGLVVLEILKQNKIKVSGWLSSSSNYSSKMTKEGKVYLPDEIIHFERRPFLVIANSFPDQTRPILDNLKFELNKDYFFAHRMCHINNPTNPYLWQ